MRWAVIRKKLPTLRWVALGAAGLVAVAGCGSNGPSWWRPGAAVLYDGTRISTAQLASEVTNLNAGYQTYQAKLGSQLRYKPSDMPREVLTWLLRFATVERLATRAGIVVTPAQAQRGSAYIARVLGQQGVTVHEFAVSIGLPPDMLPAFSRLVVIQSKLQNRLDHGRTPAQGTPAAQALSLAISHLQCVTAKGLDIQVNPQFGVLDYRTFLVVPVTTELASGQSAAQRAPHC